MLEFELHAKFRTYPWPPWDENDSDSAALSSLSSHRQYYHLHEKQDLLNVEAEMFAHHLLAGDHA
jgi:hypothetical protein